MFVVETEKHVKARARCGLALRGANNHDDCDAPVNASVSEQSIAREQAKAARTQIWGRTAGTVQEGPRVVRDESNKPGCA
jgi:hypothetical protein